MKIAINRCYGGFGLSQEAYKYLIENRSVPAQRYSEDQKIPYGSKIIFQGGLWPSRPNEYWDNYFRTDENRTDPDLIAVVEALGSKKASGQHAELKIVDIPDRIGYEITDYDGMERVEEVHNSWS